MQSPERWKKLIRFSFCERFHLYVLQRNGFENTCEIRDGINNIIIIRTRNDYK
jgi:hypothetical protein